MHWGVNDLSITWQGAHFCFHANDGGGSTFQLPSVTGCHGKEIEVDPPYQYSGPHLNANVSADTVTLSYGAYVLDYVFADGRDAIVKR